MVLTRWDPLYEIRRAHRLANRRFAGFPTFFSGYSNGAERRDWSIPLDIVRDGDNVTVKASLPGFKPEDIDVTIESGVLTIKAESKAEEERQDGGYVVRERRAGSFHRSLRLSENVDTDKVEPRYENGVLTITLPVAESEKAKHLTVAVGAALPASE
ncbi:MAG: Hsp20/alpha crystallin family protein [Chloroflexi bacterium]|nr:Hsp20/alpha crystallin family protein [Chloroflexota bacterium]